MTMAGWNMTVATNFRGGGGGGGGERTSCD